jgi:hypothetical protein
MSNSIEKWMKGLRGNSMKYGNTNGQEIYEKALNYIP